MKIAFCFLTYNNLTQSLLWQDFFEGHEEKFNIYVHNKKDFNDDYFSNFIIPNKIDTEWGKPSLVKATLLLFEEALKDKENMFFVFCSDKCIPCHNFNYIYNKIMEYNCNLFNYQNLMPNLCLFRFKNMDNKKYLDNQNYTKTNQFCCLERKLIEKILDDNIIKNFGDNFKFLDEHFFYSVAKQENFKCEELNYIFAIRTNKKQKSPNLYKIVDENNINDFKNFLFARKFDKFSNIYKFKNLLLDE